MKVVGKLPTAPFNGSLAKELLGQSKWVILYRDRQFAHLSWWTTSASRLFPIRETIDAAGKVHKINPLGDYSSDSSWQSHSSRHFNRHRRGHSAGDGEAKDDASATGCVSA